MNTRGSREVSIKYTRRKMALDLDLNLPLTESSFDQVAATSAAAPSNVGSPPPTSQTISIPLIDVDAIEDEVLLTSPRAFAEAKTNSRRTRVARPPAVVDVDVAYPVYSRTRIRKPSNLVINCEQYINLESTANSKKQCVKPAEPAPPPPPPPVQTFSCPICLGQLQEEMTTKCGHIFCKSCIKKAISVQTKCPMCKKKVNAKDIIRVYLPAMS